MSAVRDKLASDSALMALRGLVAGQLQTLPVVKRAKLTPMNRTKTIS